MKKSLVLVSICSLCLLSACGGGSTPHPTVATHLSIHAPATASAGTAFSFTVAALDASNNVATGYSGTVHFSSTDGLALSPGNSTLTNGTGQFQVTLKTTGSQTITATDTSTASITGASNSINVIPPGFAIASGQPPDGSVGISYSFAFTATGGLAPLTWSETGALPPGLVLSNGGVLSGTPTSAGSLPITVMVQDSLGENAAPQNFTIHISSQASGFIPAGSMETPRQSHTATMLNTGKVLVTGGADNDTSSLATAELFDPFTGNFAATGNMETVRAGHTATLLSDGRVLVTGGKEGGICNDRSCIVVNNSGNSLATAELFDPTTGSFTPTGNMETVRAGHTATLLGDGRVLVTGGVDNNRNGLIASGVPALATAELFDPATGNFAPTGTMETPRARHTATLINDGNVLVTGGIDRFAFAIASTELFDPASGAFTPTTGSMETAREAHTATLRKDGTVLVAGGAMLGPAFCGDRCSPFAAVSLSKAELFDPATKTFTGTGGLGTARFLHTATLLNDGSVLVTGGADSKVIGGLPVSSTVLSTTELFQ